MVWIWRLSCSCFSIQSFWLGWHYIHSALILFDATLMKSTEAKDTIIHVFTCPVYANARRPIRFYYNKFHFFCCIFRGIGGLTLTGQVSFPSSVSHNRAGKARDGWSERRWRGIQYDLEPDQFLFTPCNATFWIVPANRRFALPFLSRKWWLCHYWWLVWSTASFILLTPRMRLLIAGRCGRMWWKEPNLELICSPSTVEHMKQDIDDKENCLWLCPSSFNQDVEPVSTMSLAKVMV